MLRIGCQTPSIPRKGTETSSILSRYSHGILVRHPQFPARGRKLTMGAMTINELRCQTPSIPRKGTETWGSGCGSARPFGVGVRHPQFPARGRKHIPLGTGQHREIKSDTLNSPQGDGNETYQRTSPSSEATSDTLNSPQGDGNAARKRCCPCCPCCQTPSIPRKGTETLWNCPPNPANHEVRHPQFPARGRKHDHGHVPAQP